MGHKKIFRTLINLLVFAHVLQHYASWRKLLTSSIIRVTEIIKLLQKIVNTGNEKRRNKKHLVKNTLYVCNNISYEISPSGALEFIFFYSFILFYFYIYPPDSQESDEGANT